MKRVVLLKGGWSGEREVSLVSAAACALALRDAGYDVVEFDVTRDLRDLLDILDPRPDVVFNALHGRYGEDGRIQGLLDILAVPYTHSGALASALAMNKEIAKRLFADAGIPCPPGKVISRNALLAGEAMERPYVLKPVEEGSSLGVHIVLEGQNAPPFDAARWAFGDEVMVERYIHGREITVAVMGDRSLGVTELRTNEGFYDYEAKYTEGRTNHLVPAPIHPDAYEQAMDFAVRAHRALGCRGVTRADFRYDDRASEPGEMFLLEINTQPGMTPLSLVPEQAAHAGISFPELVSWMVENASCED
ncbi:MAG: D-alanine--D-alanine ligase [Rhodospirillaceae bacterium]|jgi:D-alanine-D-alanine ligase|nr:D-alanine--D-alanine ligase [Rhodospirillaceae bacterium]